MISEKYGRNVDISWYLSVEIMNSLINNSISFYHKLQGGLSIGSDDLARRAVGDAVDYICIRPWVLKILAIGHQSLMSDSALSLRQGDVIPVKHCGKMHGAPTDLSLQDDNHKLKDYSSLFRR